MRAQTTALTVPSLCSLCVVFSMLLIKTTAILPADFSGVVHLLFLKVKTISTLRWIHYEDNCHHDHMWYYLLMSVWMINVENSWATNMMEPWVWQFLWDSKQCPHCMWWVPAAWRAGTLASSPCWLFFGDFLLHMSHSQRLWISQGRENRTI